MTVEAGVVEVFDESTNDEVRWEGVAVWYFKAFETIGAYGDYVGTMENVSVTLT